MCGIAGTWGSSAGTSIQQVTRSLGHRGPDGEGFWQHPELPLHLGHRRLSIIDIDGGEQPMSCEEPALTISYNGEIYNHRELRATLESLGHRFRSSHSDTEVLLRAYAEWGPAMVNRLNGMWAFCIVDVAKNVCFLSRDRFGQKPLYYAGGKDWFAFASELKSLGLHPQVDTSCSETGLIKFLSYGYLPAPHTYYAGACKLPAGHHLQLNLTTGEMHIERYWSFTFEPEEPGGDEQEVIAAFREYLNQAVQRRLLADVPVGTFLSGGIDSSTVSALATNALPSGNRLKTFSIAFEEQSFDESSFANAIAKHLNSDHYCETCSLETSRELLPELIGKLDEPMGDPSLLPTYLVSGIAARQVKVALGGDGADELLSGYDPFRALAPARWYRHIPGPMRDLVYSMIQQLPVSHRNMSLDFKLKRTLRGLQHQPELWAPVWMAPLAISDLSELTGKKLDPGDVFSEAVSAWHRGFAAGGWNAALSQYFIECYLQDDILPKVDRSAMLHSLEPRSPFLDIDLVNYIRKLPERYRYRNGTSKWILRQAAESLVPSDILQRPKKGFGIPVGQWFRDGSLNFPSVPPSPRLHSETMQQLHSDHRSGSTDQRQCLWNLWLLSHWNQEATT
ncbi:MAG: asparagine synthase (glutamine-hydrolyzing) [Verrucomicrobiota bacterium]